MKPKNAAMAAFGTVGFGATCVVTVTVKVVLMFLGI